MRKGMVNDMKKKMTSFEIDSLSRNRIVSEINKNFFVEAGAGSGKTTMLVNRMAAMVEAGIDISEICAITFTKAAASEFYDRFQKLLILRSSPDFKGDKEGYAGMLPPPTDETRKRCSDALQNIDLCFMGTIDSFCGMVLSEHPSEAGIPSDSSIISPADAEMLYKQQYVKICEGDYGEKLKSLAKTFQPMHRNPEAVFVKGMSFFMDNRNVTFHYQELGAIDIDRDYRRERDKLIKAVQCLAEHPELKHGGKAASRDAWEKIADVYHSIRRKWSSSYSGVLYGLNTLKDVRLLPAAAERYGISLGDFFEPGGAKGQWLECTIDREGGLHKRLQRIQYDASMTFLIACIPVLEQALREQGNLTFFDYLYYLRNMLKKDAEGDGRLIRYIYDRHSYFLIDEFQDTNPMQAEIFFYLASENPVPQWSACVPRQGSLFIVGDPKQSIYRFRYADVASFLKVKGLFEVNGDAILQLSRNFRSARTLCEYYNQEFSEMLPEETENQSRFEEIPLPEPADEEFQGIYSYKAYGGKAVLEYPELADPIRIANIIEGLVGKEEYQIRGERGADLRPLRYSDFMVITYGKKNLAPIAAELDVRGIPSKVEGDVPFTDNQAMCEICRIYEAIADESNAGALYGALTGGLIGLTKEDILKFKACDGTVLLTAAFDKDSCTDETALRVAGQIEKLKELQALASRLSPAALFSGIMDKYRIYQSVTAEHLEVVYYALELIRNAEREGIVITLKDGAAYIRSLLEGRTDQERCLSLDADKDCVHMANLHKVKGLEAPVVILAAAASQRIRVPHRMIHGDNGSEGYLFFLEGERNEKGGTFSHFSTEDFPEELEAEKEAKKAEGKRLVYVAATRARNVLILCDRKTLRSGSEVSDSMWKPVMEESLPDIFDLIGNAEPKGFEQGDSVEAEDLYEKAEAESVLNHHSSEEATFRLENPSRLQVLSKLSETEEDGSEDEASDDRDETEEEVSGAHSRWYGALLGTMVHKLMEMLVSTENQVDVKSAVSEILREYRRPSMEAYEKELSKALLKVAKRIRSGGYSQKNSLPKDILGTLLAADEVYCEVPFCYKDETDEQIIWTGVMDVVYSDSGKWHIVDYKTNADGNDLDKKYQAQMEAYVKAFKATTGQEADAQTYHIDV